MKKDNRSAFAADAIRRYDARPDSTALGSVVAGMLYLVLLTLLEIRDRQ